MDYMPVAGILSLPVGEKGAGKRLDLCVLGMAPSFSRAFWAKAIRKGLVRVDGAVCRPSKTVRETEMVEIDLSGLGLPEFDLDPAELGDPVHQDAEMVVHDKPAGLLTHPAGRIVLRSAVVLASLRAGIPLHTCHRLDKYTSGLLVLARDPASAARIQNGFLAGTVKKTYLALTRFPPEKDRFTVDQPLAQTGEEHVKLKMLPSAEGKPARTRFEVLERLPQGALVACFPETGRQHQIRAHLWIAGSPIVGDLLYGPEEDWSYFDDFDERKHSGSDGRFHALHAWKLTLPGACRASGTGLELTAPPVGPFAALLDAWRRRDRRC